MMIIALSNFKEPLFRGLSSEYVFGQRCTYMVKLWVNKTWKHGFVLTRTQHSVEKWPEKSHFYRNESYVNFPWKLNLVIFRSKPKLKFKWFFSFFSFLPKPKKWFRSITPWNVLVWWAARNTIRRFNARSARRFHEESSRLIEVLYFYFLYWMF